MNVSPTVRHSDYENKSSMQNYKKGKRDFITIMSFFSSENKRVKRCALVVVKKLGPDTARRPLKDDTEQRNS